MDDFVVPEKEIFSRRSLVALATAGLGASVLAAPQPANALAPTDDGEIADLVEDPASLTRTALNGVYWQRSLGSLDASFDATDYPDLYALSAPTPTVNASVAMIAFMNEALTRGFSKVRLTGHYMTTETVVVPAGITEFEIPYGSRWDVKDARALEKAGTISRREVLGDSVVIPRTASTFTTASAGSYTEGEWLMIGSRQKLSGGKWVFPGWLRQVKSISGNTIELDRRLPRDAIPKESGAASLGVIIFTATLAPPLRVCGRGMIRGVGVQAPTATEKSLISMQMVENPEVLDLDIGEHSKSAVGYTHCPGGRTTAYIHDLFDGGNDDGGGYGVTFNGAVRGHVIDRGARMERCRHAVTTNSGPDLGDSGFQDDGPYGAIGEPENNWIGPRAADCSSNALDSHRVGWGNVYDCHIDGGGGVYVRADNTVIRGRISNPWNAGLAINPYVEVPPIIDVEIDNAWTQSKSNERNVLYEALILGAPSIVKNAVITRCSAWAAYTVGGSVIHNLTVRQCAGGIRIDGDAVVENARIDGVAEAAIEAGEGARVLSSVIRNSTDGVHFVASHAVITAEFDGISGARWTENALTDPEAVDLGNRLNLPARDVTIGWPASTSAIHVTARAASLGSASIPAGSRTLIPVDLPRGTMKKISLKVQTASPNANARVGVYATDPEGRPNRLHCEADGTISLASTGVRPAATLNGSAGIDTPGGRYWLACLIEDAPGSPVTSYDADSQYSAGLQDQLNGLTGPYLTAAGIAFGALPADVPAASTTCPSAVRLSVSMTV